MSDGAEREHAASAKRRAEFAKRGEVVQSRDWLAAAVLVAGCASVSIFGQKLGLHVLEAMKFCLSQLHQGAVTSVLSTVARPLVADVISIASISAAAAVFAGLLMHRGRPPLRMPAFQLSRINPLPKLQNFLSPKQVALMLAQNGVKIVGLGSVLWVTMSGPLESFVSQTPASLALGLRDASVIFERMIWRSLMAIVAFAAMDWTMNWYRLEKQMRMSTQELRDESKEDSGDPRLRGKRRRIASQLIKSMSPDSVKKADVVVVNPTHYAVAISYSNKMQAPKVVAKGMDRVAERIRAIARGAQVPVVSQPPLARLLYAKVKVGGSIPQETWQATAVVLAHVYRLKKKG